MTKTCLLDYDSIAGADKFGNVFVLRVPADVSDDVDNPTGALRHPGGCDLFFICLMVAYLPSVLAPAGQEQTRNMAGPALRRFSFAAIYFLKAHLVWRA